MRCDTRLDPQATPGARRENSKAVASEIAVLDKDGKPAQVGQSKGFWPEVADYVTTVEQRFGRPGFPRGWPECYTSSKALRRLLGKKGLKGSMSKTVDLLSKVRRRPARQTYTSSYTCYC